MHTLTDIFGRIRLNAENKPIGPPPLDNIFYPVTWKCEYCGGDHTTEKVKCPGCGAPRTKQRTRQETIDPFTPVL